ncbi:hypothetical protein HPG69_002229, partial [Diceros bicornis minor]
RLNESGFPVWDETDAPLRVRSREKPRAQQTRELRRELSLLPSSSQLQTILGSQTPSGPEPSSRHMPGGLIECTQADQTCPSGEIIGGHEAKPPSCPYVALVRSLGKQRKKVCDSVLIRKDFVLTAAHCWGSCSPDLLQLSPALHGSWAGSHVTPRPTHSHSAFYAAQSAQERTQQVIPVRRAIPHPDYSPNNIYNDIVLLKIRKPPYSGEKGQADCSCEAPQPALEQGPGEAWAGVQCGRLGEKRPEGPQLNTLQEVELTLQEDWESESRYPGIYSRATQICVGDLKKKKSSFKGDSGGPLVCKNVIQGIVSYGRSDSTPPVAYTKVSSFLPWIKKTMKSL